MRRTRFYFQLQTNGKLEQQLETHLPTKLTVANLAGILDRYVLEIVPTCGGMDGNAGTCDFAFKRDGANVYVSLPAGFAAFGEELKAGIKYSLHSTY